MQLFYLLSFVAVVSHAAALPQPAELSDKYLSNVDITLASFLGARSYHPALNPKEDSATLVSLKRRADSDGASGDDDDGSGPPPPPLLSPEDIQKIIDHFFNQSDFSSANIASTIDRVKDGVVGFFENGEKAGKEIGGTAGPLLIRYLNRVIYVYVALIGWLEKEANTVFLAIKSALGDEEYYKIIREFVRTCIKLTIDAGRKEDKADEDISNIAKRIGTVIQNVGEIGTLFGEAFNIRIKFFDKLRSPLKDSASSKILYDSMSAMITSVDKFITDQQKIHEEIMKELKPPPPK